MTTETPEQPQSVNTYIVLQETNGVELESWMYFIKYEGNEENIKHLEDELKKVDWYIEEDYSSFDIDTKHRLSEKTAKEMTLIDVNHTTFHRKFDGTLQKVNFRLKDSDSNRKKIKKVNKLLSYGGIDKFIDKEDENPPSENDEESDSDVSLSSSDNEVRRKPRSPSRSRSKTPPKKQKQPIPRFARAKRHAKNK